MQFRMANFLFYMHQEEKISEKYDSQNTKSFKN